MSNDVHSERMDRIEARQDRLETTLGSDIRRIFEKLELLTISTAKTACPAPGACVGLGDELKHVIAAHTATLQRVERQDLRILEIEKSMLAESRNIERQFHSLEKQKAWVLGAWAVVSVFSAIIGTVITMFVSKWLG